jgi:hypothetical protein
VRQRLFESAVRGSRRCVVARQNHASLSSASAFVVSSACPVHCALMQPQPPQGPKPVVPWAASFNRLSLSAKEPPDFGLEDIDDEDWSLPQSNAPTTESDRAPAAAPLADSLQGAQADAPRDQHRRHAFSRRALPAMLIPAKQSPPLCRFIST